MGRLDVKTLESLFIEKFLEKYKLTDRDMRRAFGKFDNNKNGLLDLDELTKAIQSFLNGVDKRDVAKLVDCYDVNGDGQISVEEFQEFLVNRNATQGESNSNDKKYSNNKSQLMSNQNSVSTFSPTSGGRSPVRGIVTDSFADEPEEYAEDDGYTEDQYTETDYDDDDITNSELDTNFGGDGFVNNYEVGSEIQSELPSEFDALEITGKERRSKVFLKNLLGYLVLRTKQTKSLGRLSNRLIYSGPDRIEKAAFKVLATEFAEYSRDGSGFLTRGDFRVMLMNMSSHIPGAPLLRPEIADHIFDSCAYETVGRGGRRFMTNASALAELLWPNFNDPRKKTHVDKAAVKERVGSGPIRHNNGDLLPPPAPKGYSKGPSAEIPAPADGVDPPGLYRHPKSRTPIITPKAFNPADVKRSASKPREELGLDHAFGLRLDLHSTSPIHCVGGGSISGGAPARPSSANSDRRAAMGSREGIQAKAAGCLVYCTASIAVVHDLDSNIQGFFLEHDDDVSCVTVSCDGRIAATGQIGKPSYACVWYTGVETGTISDKTGDLVMKVGENFFERGVNAVGLTSSSKCLLAIGEDDHHSMGAWLVPTGELIAQMTCQNGVPPQISCLAISPGQQTTEFLSTDNSGLCDVIVTTGDHHLRFWSLKTPESSSLGGALTANIQYKVGRIPTKLRDKISTPRSYLCAGFVLSPPGATNVRSYDVVVGGDNGYLFLFRQAQLVAHCAAIKEGVKSLSVAGTYVVVGGTRGIVKLIDARTLDILSVAETSPMLDVLPTGPPISSRGGSRGNRGDAGPGMGDWASLPRGAGNVLGLSVSRVTAKGDRGGGCVSVIAAVQHGYTMRVDLALSAPSKGTRSKNHDDDYSISTSRGRSVGGFKAWSMFHFHTDKVYGLAVDNSTTVPDTLNGETAMITVGDDRWLCLWGVGAGTRGVARSLRGRVILEAPGRCCCIDRGMAFIAVGLTNGGVYLYTLNPAEIVYNRVDNGLDLLSFRKDAKEVVSDIKFSPDSNMLAACSHDNFIYLYRCAASSSRVNLQPMHKLKGHSSYVTHIDWSVDSRLLQSTCGAYELLYWDAVAGTRFQSSRFASADVKWKTQTCVLGFGVMGIWPPGSDGTDVNALDVSRDRSLLVTADDFGNLKLFNFPCVVEDAPYRGYGGHASHVMNAKFLGFDSLVATVGGADRSVLLWKVEVPVGTSRPRKYVEALH